jgi:hypothetical protein
MSPRISELTWLSLTGISVPPRNPNNNNDEGADREVVLSAGAFATCSTV